MAQPSLQDIITCYIRKGYQYAQRISGDIYNKGIVNPRILYLGGPLADPPDNPVSSSCIKLNSLGFVGEARIFLDQQTQTRDTPALGILCGTNPGLDNGNIVFRDVEVAKSVLDPPIINDVFIDVSNKILSQTTVNQGFTISPQFPDPFVQGQAYLLLYNKTIFSYPFITDQPNVIKFASELFVNGMIFVKDVTGTVNLNVTMTLENLDSDTPLLTITGIPVEEGNCSAMLIVI